jgi:transposase-like protein
LTLESTRKNVSKIYEIPVKAISTIWRWSKKFGKEFKEVIQNLSDLLHCDETLLKTFQKGKRFWFWAIKCPKTKCIVGHHLSEQRTLRDAKLLMWEARRKFPPRYFPKAIRTDSMPAYCFAIISVFQHEVKHEKVISFKHGNNVIENFFRCKRKFPKFRNIESAKKYMNHWVYNYNAEKLNFWTCFIIRLCKAIFYYTTQSNKHNFIPFSYLTFLGFGDIEDTV